MIIKERKHEINTDGFTNSKEFTIGDTAKIFELMASKLYMKPEEAVLRELSANAVDAHTLAKNPNPFEIHIPTHNNPYFVVRDYGNGLSEAEIDEIYTVMFASNKTNSNKYLGALGLGSKSPFSITDKFTLESWYKGRKYTYCIYLNENRIPVISTTNKDGEESDEPSGCRVTIAVPTKHIYEFSIAATEVFRFFPIQPKCNVKTAEQKVLFKSDNYEIHEGYTNFYAVMGGIIYPIDTSYLKDTISGCQVYLKFEIGELSVKTSREGLVYDEKTKKKVSEAYINCIKAVRDEVNKNTEGLTGWSLYCKQNENYKMFPWLELNESIINTKKITNNPNGTKNEFQYDVWITSSNTLVEAHSLKPTIRTRIFEKDVEKGFFKALQRIEMSGVKCVVIRKTKEVMDLLGLEDSQVEKLSSIIVKGTKASGPKVYRPACEIYDKKYKNDQFHTVQVDFKDIEYYVIRENNSVVYKDKVIELPRLEQVLKSIERYGKLKSNFDRYSKATLDGKTIYAIPKSQIKNAINGKNVMELFEEIAIKTLDNRSLQLIANHSGWYHSDIDEDQLARINATITKRVAAERKKDIDEYEKLHPVYSCFSMLNPVELPKAEPTLLQKLATKFPFEFIRIPTYPQPDSKRVAQLSQFIESLNISL